MRHWTDSVVEDSLEEASSYYTVRIPFSNKPTQWHPTTSSGPFSVLTRGAFKSVKEAEAWADKHLKGQPYSVKKIVG